MKQIFATVIGILWFFQACYAQIDHWEAAVYEYDTWRYIVPDSPVDTNWVNIGFDDGEWSTGAGGFGYGDGDDNTAIPLGSISIYQRIEFTILDVTNISAGALTIDFDDGFIAYLNGVEIERGLMAGNSHPDWNQVASGSHEAQFYAGEYPEQYTLSKDFLAENLMNGTNVLSIQTHNHTALSSDLSSRAYLFLGINDTETDYGATPGWFVPPVILETSNLPIVVINTMDGAFIKDDPKVDALMGIIDNEDGLNTITDPYNEFYGQIGIEIRGSSSSWFPKKGYGLETRGPDSSNYNVSIFDWPIDNDWVLYAPYSDKSLIRNVLTYKLGNELGEYAPRTELVEVVINSNYVGVYVFMERIKQNPGRVNINEMNFEDTLGNELTGGYVVKIDKTTAGGIPAWTSPFAQAAPAWGPIRYQMHDPEIDEIHPDQLEYIEEYITDFEAALAGPDYQDPEEGYRPYIDVRSFIDFMIVNEMSKNVDGYRISTFLHKERESEGGKLVAGPLWDFNLGWGNANYCEGGNTVGWEIDYNNFCGDGEELNNPFWWNRLVTDPNYTRELNCRWQELRMTTLHTDTILNFIDQMKDYLEDAAERNFERWSILGYYVWPNNYVGGTYTEEIGYLKGWITERLEWMDENMFGSCEDLSVPVLVNEAMQLFPNPTSGMVKVVLNEEIIDGTIEVKNSLGERIKHIAISNSDTTIEIDLSDLAPAIYFVSIYQNDKQIANKKIIRQ